MPVELALPDDPLVSELPGFQLTGKEPGAAPTDEPPISATRVFAMRSATEPRRASTVSPSMLATSYRTGPLKGNWTWDSTEDPDPPSPRPPRR